MAWEIGPAERAACGAGVGQIWVHPRLPLFCLLGDLSSLDLGHIVCKSGWSWCHPRVLQQDPANGAQGRPRHSRAPRD